MGGRCAELRDRARSVTTRDERTAQWTRTNSLLSKPRFFSSSLQAVSAMQDTRKPSQFGFLDERTSLTLAQCMCLRLKHGAFELVMCMYVFDVSGTSSMQIVQFQSLLSVLQCHFCIEQHDEFCCTDAAAAARSADAWRESAGNQGTGRQKMWTFQGTGEPATPLNRAPKS